jgi:hypothetical protein
MPLYRLLQHQAFEPAQLQAMAYAFENVCHDLELHPLKDDRERERIARKVIEIAQRGECDPIRLKAQVLAELSLNAGA